MSKLPEQQPKTYKIGKEELPGVSSTLLGVNADNTYSILPGYVEIDGVRMDPSRVAESNTLPHNVSTSLLARLREKK